ncbi:MAG: hypothetical protein RBU30_27665, partial [Polyangia bacterium]|nr:hypothetical protein [Polyangia bacterium]
GGQGARQWAHGGPARPSRLSARDIEALRIERLLRGGRGRKPGDPVARTSRGTPLGALFMKPSGTWVLGRRVDGRELSLRPTPADAAHRLPGHERLGCQACHTAWTHQCAACHTRLEPAGEQWDNVVGARTAGRWVETGGDMRIDRPTLGIDPRGRIGPFIPGMPLVAAFGDVRISRRLFAPADPHTTTREARPCASCHADPLALGLGRGRLWRLDGSWHFEPAPPPEASSTAPIPAWPDGVPWDGWTGPQGPGLAEATRTGARPFGPGELRRILDVSLCLPCHGRYDDPLYKDYRGGLERLRSGEAPRCAGPREP